jgi:hypothetical protein
MVDSRRSRLYVFANANGRPEADRRLLRHARQERHRQSAPGDQKTPIGVYHVTANLPRKKLTDFYGAGAFPINYPNEWDSGRAATARHLAARRARERLQPRAARERRLHRARQSRSRGVGRTCRSA